MAERIRASGVADITGLGVRTVQAFAASGELPGAIKLGHLWTFDPAKIRLWMRQQELKTCQARNSKKPPSTSVKRRSYGGDILGTPAAAIDEAFARLMQPKRRQKKGSAKIKAVTEATWLG
ncbi:helix-turn-helix domain-containing protein [Rhodopila sp.]|uniref:helix-turn-helix domain-containing protein n=1 Tax=Rhodopila sp. TaxID=2480087 RepID=UPI003D14D5C1